MPRNEDFFREKRAAAVFKHGILHRYAVVFASKAGSTTPGGRVVFLDGYAGPGQYDDGSPGSPLLFTRSARSVESYRQVRGFFVERNGDHFANLCRVLAEVGDQRLTPLRGELDEHLADVLAEAAGAALFAFLDPFGPALARERLTGELLARRPWPTEVLLHFSLRTVARTGGLVRAANRHGRDATHSEALVIDRVDRFLGGTWWQQAFAEIQDKDDLVTATAVAQQVADGFCRTVEQATGFRSVSMPIRVRPDHAPIYLLVLFTRHPEGVWQFANALGKGGLDWQIAWRGEEEAKTRLVEEATGQPGLFSVPEYQFDPKLYEDARREAWTAGIKCNIAGLLARRGRLRLGEHTVDVYGEHLGAAWIPHVRAAVKQLHAEGLTDCTGVGEFWRQTIRPLRPPHSP
jgi:three-Cys-motif partner protein